MRDAVHRRTLLTRGGGLLAAGGLGYLAPRSTATPTPVAPVAAPPGPAFHGLHQAGIGTPRPARVILTAYDLPADASAGATRAALTELLQSWTTEARARTSGSGPTGSSPDQIATGLRPAALTVTVGIGGSLLDRLGVSRPAGLTDLPLFAGDRLEAARSDGDLLVQVCADDPVVAFAAARALTRRPGPRVRWQQTGFFRTTAAAVDPRAAGRNLMGQVDGTDDVVPAGTQDGGPIWVASDADPAWLRGGTYLVYRRIRMNLDDWEATPPVDRDRALGRHTATGAPLGSSGEHDPVDLRARTRTGELVIPADAHVRLAQPATNREAMMHRRAFSYDDGLLPTGAPDAGLLFVALQADPATGFTPVQASLAGHDALSRFTVHTAGALFAVLPGVTDGRDWLGRALLDSA